MEPKTDGEEETIFKSSSFICVDCGRNICLDEDNFMPPCCGNRVSCHRCYNTGRVKKCYQCGKNVVYHRIRAEFFEGIKEEMGRQRIKERGNVIREYQALVKKRRKQRGAGENAEQLKKEVNGLLMEYNHSKECRLYLNLDYICEAVSKITKTNDSDIVITINDILAFQCLHCGHGGRGEAVVDYSANRRAHTMFDCRDKCCGVFLDRRFLQYEGGRCECGVVIMNHLGIQPATEGQREWRLALYKGNYTREEVDEVVRTLRPTVASMGLSKPHMLYWYVTAKGWGFLGRILSRSKDQKEATLWGIVRDINEEYSVHRPIQ